jgi:hypothetical protein
MGFFKVVCFTFVEVVLEVNDEAHHITGVARLRASIEIINYFASLI